MESLSYDIYFAGELFSHKHIIGNAFLANALYEISKGKYKSSLPQDFEQRRFVPKEIRDKDILSLIESDLAIFNYDGTELDSGTVVEFMIAKFIDIPSVIIRTDFRGGGDQGGYKDADPWNLMTSFFPRTSNIIVDAGALYKKHRILNDASLESAGNVAKDMCLELAGKISDAFDSLIKQPKTMPENLRQNIFDWLMLMPNFADSKESISIIQNALDKKISKKIL